MREMKYGTRDMVASRVSGFAVVGKPFFRAAHVGWGGGARSVSENRLDGRDGRDRRSRIRRARDVETAADRLEAVDQSRQTAAECGIGAAPAVVGHAQGGMAGARGHGDLDAPRFG